jgi:hypothetical protein
MISCKSVVAAAVVGMIGLTFAPAQAGRDKVAFPENYAKGVKWRVADKPQFKQVQEFYAMPDAIEAARKEQPMPNGTVFVGVQYNVQLDGQGNPVLGPDGRFIKTNLRGYLVMEKQTGWGAEYPPELRNGEWEYQIFKADKTPNENVKLTDCFACHKPLASKDFVQAYDELKKAGQ